MTRLFNVLCFVIILHSLDISDGVWNIFDLKYWRCVLKKTHVCPDNDIKFYLYTHETGTKRLRIDIRNFHSLKYSGFDPSKKIAFIIHGFNGTESKTPMTILRDAYLSRSDYNIFTVDWQPLTRFPCYLSALSNMKLVSQCTAKLYAFIMEQGGDARETTCVGHSLGAHICGMISNHLDVKQHKIVGLDPARPLITQYGNRYFRLSKDDAHQVQIIHTNAGFLGEVNQVGHVDFCVNGGIMQPGCKGHILHHGKQEPRWWISGTCDWAAGGGKECAEEMKNVDSFVLVFKLRGPAIRSQICRSRCSHFQSACFFAKTVRDKNSHIGKPCTSMCPKKNGKWGVLPGKSIPMGEDTPFGSKGMYCVDTHSDSDCPFD